MCNNIYYMDIFRYIYIHCSKFFHHFAIKNFNKSNRITLYSMTPITIYTTSHNIIIHGT